MCRKLVWFSACIAVQGTGICQDDWPHGYSQEHVAFFGYHQVVGSCVGNPFLVSHPDLKLTALRSQDGKGLALSARYVENGAEPYVNIINIGEPNLTAPEGGCLSPGEELNKIIVVTAPTPQASHMDKMAASIPRNITGIIFVQNGHKCILGRRRGMRHRFAPPYRFKLLGVWGRASQHITEIGFLIEPLRRPEKWECGAFPLPSYAHSVGRGHREIECAGGCSHGSKFMHVSEAGIAALHVYGHCAYGCEGGEEITSLQFRFFDSSKQHVIGKDISSSVLKLCQLYFEPGEVVTSLKLFGQPAGFGRIELNTSYGQSCIAGQGEVNPILLNASQQGFPLLGFWGVAGDAIDCLGALVGDPIGQSENLSSNSSAEPANIETALSNTSVWQRGEIQFSLVAGCVTLLLSMLVCWLRRPSKPEPLQRLEKAKRSVSRLEDMHDELDRGNHQCLARLLSFWTRMRRRRAAKLLQRAAATAAGGPSFWGMTVAQLGEFNQVNQARLVDYCHDHKLSAGFQHVCLKGPCPHDHGACQARQPALAEDVRSLPSLVPNMHAVVPLIVKPATQEDQGIYGLATLMNLHHPRPVETFVSHCWNEPFANFVATLKTIRQNTSVWICSFAIPQNVDISQQLKREPMSSPFASALLRAECVLLAVDESFEPLRRSWCCYELYLAIATSKRVEVRSGTNSRSCYERLAAASHDIDIRDCQATDERDHTKIMAALKGSEDLVNRKIRERLEDTVQFVMALS